MVAERHLPAVLCDSLDLDPTASLRERIFTIKDRFNVRVALSEALRGLSGRAWIHPHEAVVHVSSKLPRSHQNLALAHELAHVALAHPGWYEHLHPTRLDTGDLLEERLCDAIAVLVGLSEAEVSTTPSQFGMAEVRDLAYRHVLPMSSVVQRLSYARNRDHPLVLARQHGQGWRPTRIAGFVKDRPAMPLWVAPQFDDPPPVGQVEAVQAVVTDARGTSHALDCEFLVPSPGIALMFFVGYGSNPGSPADVGATT